MIRNESTTDRVARVAGAVVAAVIALLAGAGSILGIILLVVAVVLLLTATSGFCPLYRVLGMSTCPVPSRSAR